MSNSEEKSWLDTLSEILTQPLPGTGQKQVEAPQPPVIHADDEDDDSLLDAITDILTQPLPGTEMPAEPEAAPTPAEQPQPEDQGEAAVREAVECADEDEDPAVTVGTAGADWMHADVMDALHEGGVEIVSPAFIPSVLLTWMVVSPALAWTARPEFERPSR